MNGKGSQLYKKKLFFSHLTLFQNRAIIRNQHTNCNNLFPIQGPSTPFEVYQFSVEKYWSTLHTTVGRIESSHFRLLAHDLKFLLLYFAKEQSLAVHSHGGAKESNIKFIPFLIQMGFNLLDSPKKLTREDRNVNTLSN